MDAIRRTAGEFIKELEEKMKELETDRGERDGIQNEKEIKIGMDTKAVELEQHEAVSYTHLYRWENYNGCSKKAKSNKRRYHSTAERTCRRTE